MGCEYCNNINDYKGKFIYKDQDRETFIILNILKIINHVDKTSIGVEIKYCPMCGAKIGR